MDTYYCLIWACFESVVLNTGPGVILTSAVLRTSENSRIKAGVHWENANWLNRCAQHHLFFLPCIRSAHQPFFFVSTGLIKSRFFLQDPLAISRDRYLFPEHKDERRVFAVAKQEVLFSSSVCIPGTKRLLGITIHQGQACQLCQMWRSFWSWGSISIKEPNHHICLRER